MKKILALSLVAALMISLMSGCTKKEDDLQNGSTAMGRYLEEEIQLPQEGRILDIRVLENGAIGNLMTDDEGMMSLWSTTDYGQMWEKEYDIVLEEEEYVSEATLLKDGAMLCFSHRPEDFGKTWQSDAQGNRTDIEIELPEVEFSGFPSHTAAEATAEGEDMPEVEGMIVGEGDAGESVIVGEGDAGESMIMGEGDEETVMMMPGAGEDSIMEMQVSEQGKVIVSTMMGQILQIDIEAGEVVREYELPEESFPMGFIIVNEDVYIQTDSGLQCYDIETGDRKEVSEALRDKASIDMSSGMVEVSETELIMTSKVGEAGSVYLVDNTGIYRQGEEGTLLEQMVDIGLTSLGMPSVSAKKMLALEDDSLLIHSENTETWEGNLYRYVYDADAKATPETEVRMYTLEDNREIRQAIAMYQKENPDTVISLQVGMTGEDGVTVSDALNALNTEIMAGNGPDILLLDGMPIDSYIEKGILEDISDVISKIDEQYGILKTGENTHAIATRFSVPYIQSDAKYVDAIKDMETMQETLREVRSEYADRQGISGGNVEELMNYLYQIDVNNFITQEEKIEKEKLQNFLEQAKQIAENNYKEKAPDMEEVNMYAGGIEGDVVLTVMELLANEVVIGRGNIRTQNDLAMLAAVDAKEDMKHKQLTDDAGEKLIFTNTILGINSKGEQIEQAKEILEFCLSKEVQQSEQGRGLPVNIEALNETLRKEMGEMGFAMQTMTDDGVGDMVELMYERPEDAKIEEFEQAILGDIRVGYSNRVVQEIVIEQLMGYVDGRVSLDEAVEGINQKVSLYLSE
jgi:ABC-type sugar transport system, periplasmic component